MAHNCACLTGVKTCVNVSSKRWFSYRWNIKGHGDVISLPFVVVVQESRREKKRLGDDPPWLQHPLKIPLDGELWFHKFQSNVITWFSQTAGNSALSLPLTMLNRQRLLWAYLITVHHAAAFIFRFPSKWHISRFITLGRITRLCHTRTQLSWRVKQYIYAYIYTYMYK